MYSFLLCWKVCLFWDLRIQFSFLVLEPEDVGMEVLPSRVLQKEANFYDFFFFFSCLDGYNMET